MKHIALVTIIFLSQYVHAQESQLFDIKQYCRNSLVYAKENLPTDFKFFQVEIRDSEMYGHEETWTLIDEKVLEKLRLNHLTIEIHQDQVQNVWFGDISKIVDDSVIDKNLSRVGLMKDKAEVLETRRVINYLSFNTSIRGEAYDSYQCFEHHAGH